MCLQGCVCALSDMAAPPCSLPAMNWVIPLMQATFRRLVGQKGPQSLAASTSFEVEPAAPASGRDAAPAGVDQL